MNRASGGFTALNSPMTGDLDHILAHTQGLWEDLRGTRLFVTGGTGFFGRWLLASFAHANDAMGLNASALVLTRDCDSFRKEMPRLAAHPAIGFHAGDVRDFDFPEGEFSYVIHGAATSAAATFMGEDPLVKLDTVVEGTRHVLDFAVARRTKGFLFTSSGAVYGKQPSHMTHIPEDYQGAPDPLDPGSPWGESKRAAELLCACYGRRYGIEAKIARCFSFIGPYLPLDIHYAAGNFIRDALAGGPITVKGDGTPYRSYLYAADLAIWLWTILLKGAPCRAYNVGSEEGITIAELARMTAQCCDGQSPVRIGRTPEPGKAPERYVPSTRRVREECGVTQTVDTPEAIRRTLQFHRSLQSGVDPESE